jgi:hypothetical protein
MRFICAFLGLLTGKRRVKCDACKNLDADNKCYGHKIPDGVVHQSISCGFWSAKKA